MPADRIELRGLRSVGTHGVLAEEQTRAQPFEVDLELEADLTAAGRSDDLADTVDYGVIIEAVSQGGPADKAGLAPGDVIVGFDGQTIERSAQLQWLASTKGVGKGVELRVAREGKQFDLKVTLGMLPEAPRQEGLHP